MRARGHARAARARTAAAAICALLLPLLLVLARAPAGAHAAAAIPARDKSKAKASRGKPQAAARDGAEASGPDKGLAPCQWKDPETGLRFDWTALVSASHYSFVGVVEEYGEDALHNARDLDDAHHPAGIWDGADFEGYRYMINFCNPARTVPDICVSRGPPAAAYQVTMDGRGHGAGTHPEGCRALGAVNNMTWSLLDSRDPELGVRLTYRGGEPCRKRPAGWTDRDRDWVSVDRTFSIDMVCDPSDRGSEGLIKSVTMATASETEMCAYTLVWPSRFGCAVNARGARADMSTAWAHGRQPHWLLNLRAAFAMGCLVAFMIAGAQCYRHRRTVRLLAPDCARGRRAAWRALWRTLLPAPGDLLASGTIERMGGAFPEDSNGGGGARRSPAGYASPAKRAV